MAVRYALLFGLCLGDLGAAPFDDERLEIVFFDVGQGDCTLVKCPDGRRILIDCGSISTPRPDPRPIAEELRRHLDPRSPAVHVLVVTHPDQDHYNLIERVLQGVAVERILIAGEFEEYRAAGFDRWLGGQRKTVQRLEPDDESLPGRPSPHFGPGKTQFFVVAADVRGPNPAANFVKNSRSIVLKVTFGKFDALLTGDATRDTEDYILRRIPPGTTDWLDVELLKLGHHGSVATSTQQAWMDRVKPEFAVASAGRTNSFGHPSRTVVERGRDYYVKVPPHTIRWAVRAGTANLLDHAYDRAFWNTASSGTIRVIATGEREREAHVEVAPPRREIARKESRFDGP